MIRRIVNKIINKLEGHSRFMRDDRRYAKYEVGEWTYGSPKVYSFAGLAKLKIGRFCSLADGVKIILDGEHRIDWVSTYPFSVMFKDASGFKGHPATKGDVVIGNDVWIGTEALVLSGIRIQDGAVVAARSVVTKDVAPYSIVAGNPARHIRYRFDEGTVREMLRIKWWDWPIERIKEAWPLIMSPGVKEFIARHSENT